jgi:hypothetical protein
LFPENFFDVTTIAKRIFLPSSTKTSNLENSTLSSYLNLARSLFENASFKKKCGFGDLLQINIYKANRTSDLLLLFYIADVCGVKYELEIFRKHQGEIVVDQYVEGYELKLIEFGMALDLKEEIFRDFVSILQKVY